MEQIGDATVLPAMDAIQRIVSEHSELQRFRSEYETMKTYLNEIEETIDVTEQQLEDAESEIAENERIRNIYREEQREMTRMIVGLESRCIALQTERDRIERALKRVVSNTEKQKRQTGQRDDENHHDEMVIMNLEKSLEELIVENQELRLQIKKEKVQSAVSHKEADLLKRQLEEALQTASRDKALLKDLRALQSRNQEFKGQQLESDGEGSSNSDSTSSQYMIFHHRPPLGLANIIHRATQGDHELHQHQEQQQLTSGGALEVPESYNALKLVVKHSRVSPMLVT